MISISPVSDHRCHLGEGPVWDSREQALYWVDSFGPRLYRYQYRDGSVDTWDLPGETIGSLALRESGGLILAMDQGVYTFSTETTEIELIAQPLEGKDGLRFNDGKVDRFGSFVAGAMNQDHHKFENAAMYRLSPDFEVSEILDGFSCFNGPCFSKDADLLYVTGREEGVVEVFEYGETQSPQNAAVLIAGCNPDGATVDQDGCIWSAQWDSACILRITPKGEIDTRISFPDQIVSSVMFGGPELDLIFVTTVGDEVQGAVPASSDAGKLLVVEGSRFRGREEFRFNG